MSESERVEREFKRWSEKYNIPLEQEFQVKTLLKLQNEYDNIKPADNNTRTRETLLKMINEVQRGIVLKSKTNNKTEKQMQANENILFRLNELCNINFIRVLKRDFRNYDCRFLSLGDSCVFECNKQSYVVETKSRNIILNSNILHIIKENDNESLINNYLEETISKNIHTYLNDYYTEIDKDKTSQTRIITKISEDCLVSRNIKIIYGNYPIVYINNNLELIFSFQIGIEDLEKLINRNTINS